MRVQLPKHPIRDSRRDDDQHVHHLGQGGRGRRHVPPEGTGSHRIVIGGDAGSFTDPDGFAWETDDA